MYVKNEFMNLDDFSMLIVIQKFLVRLIFYSFIFKCRGSAAVVGLVLTYIEHFNTFLLKCMEAKREKFFD